MADFDAIVVGAGHNGLGLACYLGKSGLSVLVCEAQPEVGGYLHTEEVIKGFRHSMHAVTMGTYPPIYRDFDLSRYGTRFIKADVEFGLVMKRGSIVVHNGLPKENAKVFAKFSKNDAKTLESIHKKFHATWMKEFYSPPLPVHERGAALGGEERAEWKRICSLSVRELIDELFESDEVKLFAALRVVEENPEGYGVVSAGMKEEYRGTADQVFKALTDPQYAIVEGGTRRLAEGLARVVGSQGGAVLTKAPVQKIIVRDGRAAGVKLADGRVYNAKKVVACNINPETTIGLAGEENFDPQLVKRVRSLKVVKGKFDLHIASHVPPRYPDVDDKDVNRSVTAYVGYEGMETVDAHAADALAGRLPEKPSFESTCQTLYDPSLAPPGKHTLTAWNFISIKAALEMTEADVVRHTDALLSRWREFAPDLTYENLIDVYPYYNRNWRGYTGMTTESMGWGQYYDARPTPELSGYRTPVAGLYLSHSSCHPGSSVRFGPCYNSFTVIAKDLGIKKWWSDPVPGLPFALE